MPDVKMDYNGNPLEYNETRTTAEVGPVLEHGRRAITFRSCNDPVPL